MKMMMATMKMLLLSLMIILWIATDGKYTVNAQTNDAVAPLLEDNVLIRTDVPGRDDARISWTDSYSVGDSCYCSTTFDHEIGDVVVNTPLGILTVRQVCDLLGSGPGRSGRPLYNDIQCGNGPPNNVGDENDCPGRVEYGIEGCGYIGPMWNFTALIASEQPTRSPVELPTSKEPTSMSPVTKAPVTTATMAPVSKAPSTKAPTKAPISKAPITAATMAPATKAPTATTTQAPVSKAPVTTTKGPVSKAPATKAPTATTTKAPISKAPVTTTKGPVSKAPETKAPTATTTKAPISTSPTKAASTSTPTIMPMKVSTKAPDSEAPVTSTPSIPVVTGTPTTPITSNEPTAMPVSATTAPTTKVPVTVATPSNAPKMVRTEAPTKLTPTSSPIVTPTLNLPTTSPLQEVPVPVDVTRVPTSTPVRRLPRARILNMTLYDTTNNLATPIRKLDRQGTIFDLAVVGTKLTIATEVESDVDDVYIKYTFDDSFTNVASMPYFTLNGNSGTDFNRFRPLATVGTHTIVASLFNGETDSLLDTVTFDVTIIDSSTSFTGPFVGFNLIDVSTQRQRPFPDIIILGEFRPSLSLNALTGNSDDEGDTIYHVMFFFDNRLVRVEESEPWTLGANIGSYFLPTPLLTVSGSHTVVVVALNSDDDVLGSLSIKFRVIGNTSTQPPTLLPVSAPIGITESPTAISLPSDGTRDPTSEPSLSIGSSSTGAPSRTGFPSMVGQTLTPTATDVPTNVPNDPTFMPSETSSPTPSLSRVLNNVDTGTPTMENTFTAIPSLLSPQPTSVDFVTDVPTSTTFFPTLVETPSTIEPSRESNLIPINAQPVEPPISDPTMQPPTLRLRVAVR